MPYINREKSDEIIAELCWVMKELRSDEKNPYRKFYMNRINIVLNYLGVHAWDEEEDK